ncbi:MAG: NfeD family protein [Akkermansia sp.]
MSKFIDYLSTFLKALDLLPDFNTQTGIFCAMAWIATLIALLLFGISFIADLGDGDADAGSGDGDAGWFSVRAVNGFLLGFGWAGFVASNHGCSVLAAIGIGLLIGLIMFLLVAILMRFINGLKCDGTLQYTTLVGMTGTVYVTLPPGGEPGGQVQVNHPGQMLTMQAVQYGDKPLPAQTRVVVVDATSQLLTVRPFTAEDLHNHNTTKQ